MWIADRASQRDHLGDISMRFPPHVLLDIHDHALGSRHMSRSASAFSASRRPLLLTLLRPRSPVSPGRPSPERRKAFPLAVRVRRDHHRGRLRLTDRTPSVPKAESVAQSASRAHHRVIADGHGDHAYIIPADHTLDPTRSRGGGRQPGGGGGGGRLGEVSRRRRGFGVGVG